MFHTFSLRSWYIRLDYEARQYATVLGEEGGAKTNASHPSPKTPLPKQTIYYTQGYDVSLLTRSPEHMKMKPFAKISVDAKLISS